MSAKTILNGVKFDWSITKKIGEGDAGEVWLAQAVESQVVGILKRAAQHTMIGEIDRQAICISNEGNFLKALDRMKVDVVGSEMRAVKLLDRYQKNEIDPLNKFIVMERAAGFDIKNLAQIFRSRQNISHDRFTDQEINFLQLFASLEQFPSLLLASMVAGLVKFLERIHELRVVLDGKSYRGIVWNDIKIDHIFWDPSENKFTLIDWGNAQPLAIDQKISPEIDYRQLITAMQEFLEFISPEMLDTLKLRGFQGDIQPIIHEATSLAYKEFSNLSSLKRRESELLKIPASVSSMHELESFSNRIVAHGEAPNPAIFHRLEEIKRIHESVNFPFKRGEVILHKYRIEEFINRGSFGNVYRVTHLDLDVQEL